jgi:hypothetical protein
MGITPPPPPYSNLSCGGGSSIGFHRSNSIGASPSSGASPEVAAALFAQPAAGNSVGGATTAAAINEASVALPSHTPTMVETTPTPRSALELFGTPASTEPQQQPQQLAASFAPQNFSAPMEHAAAAAIGGDDDLQMDDIPLTPGDGSTKPVILPVDPAASTVSGNAGPTAIGVVADTASNSLFGAIGMPPPPFSRK